MMEGSRRRKLEHRKVEVAKAIAPTYLAYAAARLRIGRIRDAAERHARWERMHQWGAKRVVAIVENYGGFYTKLSQILGSATQMVGAVRPPGAAERAGADARSPPPPSPYPPPDAWGGAQDRRAQQEDHGRPADAQESHLCHGARCDALPGPIDVDSFVFKTSL